MAKKKGSIRKSIRINGVLFQESFPDKHMAGEWYSKMNEIKARGRAGLEIPFEPVRAEVQIADFLCARDGVIAAFKHEKARMELYILPHVFGRELHTITRKEWKKILDDLVTVHGLSAKTHNNIRGMLNKMLEEAKRDEPPRVVNNPIAEIPPKKVIEQEIEFFRTREECERYLEHGQAEGMDFLLWATFALNTGGRETEIAVLQYSDIDFHYHTALFWKIFDKATCRVAERTKGKKQRRVPLNDSVMNALIAHRAQSKFQGPADYIMTSSTGRHLDPKTIWEAHGRTIKAAGLRYISPHGLRHTFATQYLENGGSLWDLKNILGHSTIKQTEKYAHIVESRRKEKASVFEVAAPKVEREVIELRGRANTNDALGDASVMHVQAVAIEGGK